MLTLTLTATLSPVCCASLQTLLECGEVWNVAVQWPLQLVMAGGVCGADGGAVATGDVVHGFVVTPPHPVTVEGVALA